MKMRVKIMEDNICMDSMQIGQRACVLNILLHGALRRRFYDIGFVPGNDVFCVGVSPLGDPKAYLVNDTVVAVRSDDAKCVIIKNIR
jgi:ferrous iron transport protein A